MYQKLIRLDPGSLQRAFHYRGDQNVVLKSPWGVPFGPTYRQTAVAVAEMTRRATYLLANTLSFISDYGHIVQQTQRTRGGQVVEPFCEKKRTFEELGNRQQNYAWHIATEAAKRAQRILSEEFPVELRLQERWQLRSTNGSAVAQDYVPLPSQWKVLYRRSEERPELDVPPLEAICQVVDDLDGEPLSSDWWMPAVWADPSLGNFRFAEDGTIEAWLDPVVILAAEKGTLMRSSPLILP